MIQPWRISSLIDRVKRKGCAAGDMELLEALTMFLATLRGQPPTPPDHTTDYTEH